MKRISSMTLWEFFGKGIPALRKLNEAEFAKDSVLFYPKRCEVRVWKHDEEGDGFRADTNGHVCYGDTPGTAIQAAYDAMLGLPSKRCRLNPPFHREDREKGNWKECCRMQYDYRAADFKPPATKRP